MKLTLWMELVLSYVLMTLACAIYPIERHERMLKASPDMLPTTAGAGQFAGLTTLDSGTAFATISTAVVTSGCLINAAFSIQTTCGSGIGYQTAVSSIVDGVSFAYGYMDGQGRAPGGTVMWEIRKTA